MRAHDLEDIASTVTLRLVRRLQQVPAGEETAIVNLADFTARLTYNAVYEVLRRRFPERTRLKNRLRYVLTRDPRFATWLAGEESVAGLRDWSSRMDVARNPSLAPADANRRMLDTAATGDAIEAILARLGAPLLLNDLTNICAELWGVSDAVPEEAPEAQASTTPAERFETQQKLAALWSEIRELPPPQRAALLLNLRDADGHNAISLFVLLDVAGLEDIAHSLEMSVEQLADIWNDLPVDDLTIASMLGKTRQQIINLRKSARERLARRMRQ